MDFGPSNINLKLFTVEPKTQLLLTSNDVLEQLNKLQAYGLKQPLWSIWISIRKRSKIKCH